MLKCSTSLWSADLGALAADMRRVEPYSERFHLDVADGHYSPTMLFFPDLVAALRSHSDRPFEMHLMAEDPAAWIEPFAAAGADIIIFCFDAVEDPGAVLDAIKARGLQAGVSLLLEEEIALLDNYWDRLDVLTLLGTQAGIKGADMHETAPGRIRQARSEIEARGLATVVEADGGIRRHTVPLLAAAGADFIVPGSLMFKEDPADMRAWLAGLA
jgi:ribulose-phosphate 3-epimerase